MHYKNTRICLLFVCIFVLYVESVQYSSPYSSSLISNSFSPPSSVYSPITNNVENSNGLLAFNNQAMDIQGNGYHGMCTAQQACAQTVAHHTNISYDNNRMYGSQMSSSMTPLPIMFDNGISHLLLPHLSLQPIKNVAGTTSFLNSSKKCSLKRTLAQSQITDEIFIVRDDGKPKPKINGKQKNGILNNDVFEYDEIFGTLVGVRISTFITLPFVLFGDESSDSYLTIANNILSMAMKRIAFAKWNVSTYDNMSVINENELKVSTVLSENFTGVECIRKPKRKRGRPSKKAIRLPMDHPFSKAKNGMEGVDKTYKFLSQIVIENDNCFVRKSMIDGIVQDLCTPGFLVKILAHLIACEVKIVHEIEVHSLFAMEKVKYDECVEYQLRENARKKQKRIRERLRRKDLKREKTGRRKRKKN